MEPRPEQRGSYTRAKLEAESIVRAAVCEKHLEAIILRPGHIWSESGPLLSPAVGQRLGRHLLMVGDRDALLPLVHVDDVVRAAILAMRKEIVSGEVFHVVDDDPISREEIARFYIASRDPQLRIVHVPLTVVATAASVLGAVMRSLGYPLNISPYRLRSGVASVKYDCAKALNELGWRPLTKSRTALHPLPGESLEERQNRVAS
jgi:nucleoside-diphosphate-sugar epimerase